MQRLPQRTRHGAITVGTINPNFTPFRQHNSPPLNEGTVPFPSQASLSLQHTLATSVGGTLFAAISGRKGVSGLDLRGNGSFPFGLTSQGSHTFDLRPSIKPPELLGQNRSYFYDKLCGNSQFIA